VKIPFNRAKGWADIESMIESGTAIDHECLSSQLVSWCGPAICPRVALLRTVLDAARR